MELEAPNWSFQFTGDLPTVIELIAVSRTGDRVETHREFVQNETQSGGQLQMNF